MRGIFAFRGIRGRLLLLLLIVLGSVLAGEALIYSWRFTDRKAMALEGNLELARAVGKTFATFVQQIVRGEGTLGAALTTSPPLTAQARDRLLDTFHAETPGIRGVYWITPDGTIVASSARAFIGYNVQDRSYVQAILAGRPWAISERHIGRSSGKAAFTISRGIRTPAGSLVGIVAATFEPDQLDSVLGVDRAIQGGVSLVDHTGMLVYRYPPVALTLEQRQWLKHYPVLAEALQGNDVLATLPGPLTGQPRLVAFAPIPSLGWVAAAGRQEAEVVRAIHGHLLVHAGLLLLIVGVGGGAAVALARPLTNGIVALRRQALALGRGDLEQQAPASGPPELTELATAFTQMATAVQAREAALQDSEARFRALTAATFEGIAMAAEGRYLDMNEQWCALLGYRREELLGRDITANIPAEDQARVLPSIRAGAETHVEHTMVRKDGTRMLVEVRGRTIQYQNRPVRVAAIRDITARKQVEAALRLSEEKFAKAFAANPAAIALMRLTDGRFLEVNDTYLAITGFRRDEVVGRTFDELGLWVIPAARPRAIATLRQQGAIREWEERFRKKSGEEFDALLSADLITLGGQELILSTCLDITARKRQEETLRRYQLLAERARDIVLFVARDGRILEGNHAAVLAYGYSPEELRTRHIQDLRASETHALTAAQMAQAAAGGILFETVHRRCDGTMFPVEVSSCGTQLGGDHVLLSIVRDITDRKGAEQALQRAKDELEQRVQERTAELSQAIQTLERQAEQLRALAGELTLAEQRERRRLAEILHDGLQQILVAARLRATLLGQSRDPQVQQESEEVVALLQEALAQARTLTGELSPPTLRRGDLPAALAWASGWMKEKHRLTVRLHTPATPLPTLPEDVAGLLYQAVRELLFNVVKHAQVPAADVTLAQVGAAVQVTVADAGIGFEPSRLSLRGFGLLNIRERLELLGGRLDIASTPGQGSQFTLWAPLQPAGPGVPGVPAAPVPLAPVPRVAPPSERHKLRILLVDDHAMVRQGFARLLNAEPDLEIVGEAADGKAAVELAGQLQPDVVTMDVNLPVLDGIEATRQIRAQCPAVRVIGLSLFDSTEQARAMREAGAAAYVTKSGPVEELLTAIRGRTGGAGGEDVSARG